VKLWSQQNVTLLLLTFLQFVVSGGRDALLNTLLYTYVDEYLGWTTTSAALLVTVYHVTRAVAHAVLVPVSRRVSPTPMMLFSVATLLVSSCLMSAALVVVVGDALTVVGVVVTALATSNTHATTVSLVDDLIAPYVVALSISAIGLGQIVVAPVTGRLLETAGAASFPLMLLALASAALTLFCAYCVVIYVNWPTRH